MTSTVDLLSKRLLKPLPGAAAHELMYPRKGASVTDQQDTSGARLSSVAILLFEIDNTLQFLVIRRSEYDGTHSGQIAFPGGKWEQTDASLVATALRECEEEIGVTEGELDYVGKLTDVFTVVSSFIIEPHIFYWKTPHDQFIISEREVAAVYSLSVDDLLNESAVEYHSIPLKNGITLKDVPHFALGEVKIWGATALILSELKLVFQSL
ncbi:MAG: CoA pyrophosphatase [Bacteroidota bacterium]